MTSAPILRSVTVSVDQHRAFSVFTDELGAWWPTQSHGIFGPACGRVAFEHGLLIERATDGEQVVWGEVLAWEPPHRLCFTWHPGRAADDASEVEVRFVDTGSATRVEIEHRGWERFGAQATARRRGYIGPGTWGAVLEHYADVTEPTTDAADLLALATAYEAFYLEAERGGFGAPPDGEWDALRTIAHVALNDYAMTAVTHSILHGAPTAFENLICQDPAVLTAHIERYAGDLSVLVDHGRRCATTLLAILGRLGPAQRATPVACRLHHDGALVLDAERPWEEIAITVQAARHLPAHTAQLAALRR